MIMNTLKRDILPTIEEKIIRDGRLTAVVLGLPCVGKSTLLRQLAASRGSGYILADLSTDRELRMRILQSVEDPGSDSVLCRIGDFFGLDPVDFQKTMFLLDGAEYLGEKLADFLEKHLPDVCLIACDRADYVPEKASANSVIQYIILRPLSFSEFLSAAGHDDYRGIIRASVVDGRAIPKLLRDDLEELYYDYLLVGGFPQPVLQHLSSRADLPSLRMAHRQVFSTIVQSLSDTELLVKQEISRVRLGQIIDYYRNTDPDVFAFRPGSIRRGLCTRDFLTELQYLCDNGFLIRITPADGSFGFPFGGSQRHNSDNEEYCIADSGLLRFLRNDYDAFYSIDAEKLPEYILRQSMYQSCISHGILPSYQKHGRAKRDMQQLVLTDYGESFSIGKKSSLVYRRFDEVANSDSENVSDHNIMWFELDGILSAKKCPK